MPHAPAPSRSTGSGTLTFGLLSIPVKVYSGTEDVRVKRSEYTADGDKVGRLTVNKETGEEVAYRDIVKMVETTEGLVALSDEEVANLLGVPNGTFDVTATVPLSTLFQGRYVPQSVLQVRPDKAAAKAFDLLLKGLAKTQTFALVSYCLRGTPRVGALLPTGRLYVLHYDDEVREDREVPAPKDAPSDAEVDLMCRLIDANTQTAPEVPAAFQAEVRAYCEDKAAGGDVVAALEVEPAGTVDDLMATLSASLGAA